MLKHRSPILTLILFVILFLSFTQLNAQTTTAALSGTVIDANGSAVPGATVTLTDTAKGFERKVVTGDSGSFAIPLLPASTYMLTVTRDGFAPSEIQNIILNVADQKALNILLKVGPVTGSVNVSPDASLVNTSPAVATTIDRNFVQNIPLNGRSFQSLILLTPGVVPTVSNGAEPGQFSVNGQRTNTNYFTIDGVGANTGISASSESSFYSQQAGGAIPGFTALGTTSSLVSVDALEEFKIQTSTYSAEFGRQPGGQVQLVTRSGGNQFHGSIYDYLRNDKLDARNFFNPVPQRKPPLRQNDFGGTFSGPIFLPRFGEGNKPYWSGKNKSFFFFSYEGLRLLLPVLPETDLAVPSLRLRQAAPALMQPFLNAYPLPTGPEAQYTHLVVNPAGNPCDVISGGRCLISVTEPSGFAPFQTAWSNPSSVDAWSIRLDHTVNKKLTLFGRYGLTPSNTLVRSLSQLTGTVSKAQTLTVGAISILTSNVNNDLRSLSALTAGYSGQGPVLASIYFQNGPFSTATLQQGYSADNSQRQFNIVDNLSITKGNHSLKFGMDWRRLSPTFGPTAFLMGLQFYSPAGVMNSSPDLVHRQANQVVKPIYTNLSLYAQDTWKVSDRLILDFGLRWEVNPPPYDANGLNPVIVTGIQGGDVLKAALAPAGTPFYKTFYGGFSPRVGVAFTLRSKVGRETVLRGGFGLYNDLGNGSAVAGFGYFPWHANVQTRGAFFGQPAIPFPLPSNLAGPPPLPTTVALPLNSVGNLYALNPNLKLPYTVQWSAAVQQSLGKDQTVTLSYVGSAARRQLETRYLNQQDPVTFVRPNSNFGNLLFTDNGPTSDYHALQAQYQRRLSHGLQLLANYTWSHAIDDISNEVGNFGGIGYETQDRGNANFDVRHNFSLAATYNLPTLQGSRALTKFGKGMLNGWSVDPILYMRSGFPLDVFAGDNLLAFADGTQIAVRPDLIHGVSIWVADSTVPGGRQINPAAFTAPPLVPGTSQFVSRQGSLGRNSVIGPGMYQVNVALRRRISIGEKLGIQLGLEVFNIDNHPMFGNYQTYWFSGFSDFGKPQSTLSNGMSDGRITAGALNSLYQLGGPRSIQLSARISF